MIGPYVFDTNMFSIYGTDDEHLRSEIESRPDLHLQVSVITVEECLTGWYDYLRAAKQTATLANAYGRLSRAVRVFNRFEILDFTEAAIQRYAMLKKARLNIGGMDLRIAAIAIEHDCVVVTRNLRDFARVPGLLCEDWSA